MWLNISSSSRNYVSNDVDSHYVLLGLEIRECLLGEVFEKITNIVGDGYDDQILFKCVSCPYGT